MEYAIKLPIEVDKYTFTGYIAVFTQPLIQTCQYLDNTVFTNQNRDKEEINKQLFLFRISYVLSRV